jgi:hypothetical protein
MAERGGNLRCTSFALLSAWVVMAFGTSALLVLAGVAGDGEAPGLSGFLAATWRVTDEMGPAAKILLIAIFAALVLAGERLVRARAAAWQRYAVNIALGAAGMVLTLAIIPAALSRWFGIGLTGARLDPSALPFYLAGGALGAIAFTYSAARCRARVLRAAGT